MGQVVIEIPQDIFAAFRLDDAVISEQLLDDLKPYSKDGGRKDIVPPRSSDREKALEEVFGIWSDRKESGQEIARQIRANNRKVT